MHMPWNVRSPIAIFTLLLASLAFAQATTYENPELGFRLNQPAGWDAVEDTSPEGMLTLQFAVPSGQGAVGLVAVPLAEEDRAYWTGPREALVRDVWEGFLPEVPGAQITQAYEITVAGALGSVIDYASPTVAGSIVIVVDHGVGYTFFSVGDQDSLQAVQGALHAMVGSFAFMGGMPVGPAGDTGGTSSFGAAPPVNPLDAVPPVNPLDAAPPANPLDASTPANPLDVAPPGPMADPHVGVFADERLRLTLDAAPDGLAGELVLDGNRFPVTARAANGGITGHFQVGADAYAFDARLEGDGLSFVTADVRYDLRRER